MGQRHSGYERHPADFYPTPAWVTEALLPHLPRLDGVVWEPAAGNGAMLRVLMSGLVHPVVGSDIAPADHGVLKIKQHDFLKDEPWVRPAAIVTNPPFGKEAAAFAVRALDVTRPRRGVVAMLFRSQFHHAKAYRHLFGDHPAFSKLLVLTRRIVWFVDPDTGKPKAAPSDTHCWAIWDWRHAGPPVVAYGPDEVLEAAE